MYCPTQYCWVQFFRTYCLTEWNYKALKNLLMIQSKCYDTTSCRYDVFEQKDSSKKPDYVQNKLRITTGILTIHCNWLKIWISRGRRNSWTNSHWQQSTCRSAYKRIRLWRSMANDKLPDASLQLFRKIMIVRLLGQTTSLRERNHKGTSGS